MEGLILISLYSFALITPIFAIAFIIDWGAKQIIKRIENK